MGHSGEESFQSITCTGTYNLNRSTKRENTKKSKIIQHKMWP